MPHSDRLASSQKSLLERTLSLVTEVRAGEGVSALLLAANAFYLLAFYQVLKLVREALILSESGAVAASYASAAMAAVLFVFVPAYSAFAARVNRVWLVCGVTLFFASHLLIFYALGMAGARVGVGFYIWIGVFNMVAVAQFWAFANDVYSSEKGRRLFPLVGVGATLGAALGSLLATVVFGGLGPYVLMLIAAFGLLVPVVLTIAVNKRESVGGAGQETTKVEADKPLAKGNGFKLVLTNRYLLLIALMVLVFNLVNTLGGFMLNTMITDEAARRVASGATNGMDQRAIIAMLSGTVLTSVNILAFVLQTFVVSRLFKYIGVRGALFVLPIIALTGYTAVVLLPILMILQWTKIFENATDYSIQNTTRHALFLPTSREAKYNAKQAIDAFFVRTGDLLQAGVVFIGVEVLTLSVRSFAFINVVLVGIWLLLAVGIAREHRKLVGAETTTRHAA
jgi:ATP:ADP antiporter, AAA family